jgi:NADPH:quinone reductase-like Zn-dependent oxidoreductase
MKAIVRDRYGSPDVMRVADVPMPELTDEGVLVRVRATSINALDWHMLRGKPYITRLDEGLRAPKSAVLGVDVAGTVEAVGAEVTGLAVGDRVFGSRSGAFAEYVVGRNMVPMPANLTFEQAAAVSVAGQTALQGLRDKGGLVPGQRVLIIGAGGGVGTFAVQIAKALGADVTAVTNTGSVDLVRSLGADRVADYTRENVTRGAARYDLIMDIGGQDSLASLRRVLAPGGRVVMVAPGRGNWVGFLARIGWAIVTSRLSSRKVLPFLSNVSTDDLLALKEMIEAGKVTPVVDRTYPLEQTPDAIRYVEEGRARGKVVITV